VADGGGLSSDPPFFFRILQLLLEGDGHIKPGVIIYLLLLVRFLLARKLERGVMAIRL